MTPEHEAVVTLAQIRKGRQLAQQVCESADEMLQRWVAMEHAAKRQLDAFIDPARAEYEAMREAERDAEKQISTETLRERAEGGRHARTT